MVGEEGEGRGGVRVSLWWVTGEKGKERGIA